MKPRLIAAEVLASLWLHRLTWSRERGVPSVAPATPVVRHDGPEAQGVSRPPPLWCFGTGVKPAFIPLSFY
jgi:hypothetical protein